MTSLLSSLNQQPWRWLLLGAVLLVLAQVSHVVALLAWIAPVPWLRFLRTTSGWRSRLALFVALGIAWTLAVFKIASEPMFFLLAPLFSLPLAIGHGAVLLAWDAFRRRAGDAIGAAFFALALAAEEAALHSLTELGSWGATAYTQLHDTALLQVASVVGLTGAGAIVSFVGAAIEAAMASERGRPSLAAALVLAVSAQALGAARLWLADVDPPEPIRVAMIATDADVAGLPLPDRETTHAWDAALLRHTREAAAGGAELAVWTEAATLVWPDEEDAWVAEVARVAREANIDVVAGYVMAVSDAPLRYRNEYRLVLRDGTVEDPYAKRHPVPGEPAIAGEVVARFTERPWGVLSGAICYDYDFPAMARARRAADVVAIPASDWRGIDPVHAEMAAVRSIESGHAIVRSTRFGLSVATDAYGRLRARRSAFEPGAAVVFASVPTEHVETVYAALGEWPLLGALAVVVALGVRRPA